MYIRNTSALLIAVVCLMATVVYSAEDCYKPLNNGALEDYHVQGTYFPSPYACNPSSDNVAFAAPSTYTFTIGDGPSCGEIISMQGKNHFSLFSSFFFSHNQCRGFIWLF